MRSHSLPGRFRALAHLGLLAVWSSAIAACGGAVSTNGRPAPGDAGEGDGNGSSSGGGSGSISGSGSGSSGGSGGSSGSNGGSTGSSSGGSSGGGKCTMVPLTPNPTGYVSTTSLNIVGAWFAYGDNLGLNGAPPGNCETKSMHTASQCSVVTSPAPPTDGGTATFPQMTPGTMCLSGTAAQVIGSPLDYSNMFGIGIGLDFNNPSGTPMTYDAMMNHVTGFQFTVAGLPMGTVRVEFPGPPTGALSNTWSYTVTQNGTVTVNLMSGTGAGDLGPYGPLQPPGPQPVFDPTQVEAIQFHVVTNKNAPVTVTNFCVSDLQAIVCP